MSNPQYPGSPGNPNDPQNPKNPQYPPPGGYQQPPSGYGPGPYQQPGYGQPPQYGGNATPYQLAGVGMRFLALLIDGFIEGIPVSIIGAMFGTNNVTNIDGEISASSSLGPVGTILGLVIAIGYLILCYQFLQGRTVGQKVLSLRLVNQDGGTNASLGTFVLYRTVGYFINGFVCLLGYIWALFDSQKQTWGQKITKTVTIQSQQ
jgi:uncharacterized RDD family membrane protein YckC